MTKNSAFFFVWSLLLILLQAISLSLPAQSTIEKDACLWQNFYIEKKITKKISFHINEEARFDQNITRFYYLYADFGITYKYRKWLHFSVDYVPIIKNLNVDWSKRHQFYADAVGIYSWKRFKFYERAMVQWQYDDIYSSEKGVVPNWFFRNKLTAKADYYRFTPYVAFESFYHFADPEGNSFNRLRYFAGVFIPVINPRNSIEFYYLIEQNLDATPRLIRYIIGIGYELDF
jgi:hypothetical protein